MAYCNSGPAVAAYLVEKISGQRFEDFVEQNLFHPIGMKTATYFPPPAARAATLYHSDGKTPYPYQNALYRPPGAINASGRDMAAYLQFYLNRGMVNGVQVVPAANIDRMEVPTSTWAAKEGLKSGYGLGNSWSIYDGFVYHGHGGAVMGGLTAMAYLPEYGVGYFYSINSMSFSGWGRVDAAIRGYITSKLQKPAPPAPAPLPPDALDYAGWYEPDSPRWQVDQSINRLVGLSLVRFRRGKLLISALNTHTQTFLPVEGGQFRYLPKGDAPQPVAALALVTPNRDGRFIQSFSGTLKRIPAWLALLQIVLTAFVAIAMISIAVYAPFWLLAGLSKKRRRPAERWMRLWPLLTVLSLVAVPVLMALSAGDPFVRMGNLTFWSGGIFLATVAFAVAAVAGAIAWWMARRAVRSGVRTYCLLVTLALLIAVAYFAYWGMIGLRTWNCGILM
jgi:hypothetical protein